MEHLELSDWRLGSLWGGLQVIAGSTVAPIGERRLFQWGSNHWTMWVKALDLPSAQPLTRIQQIVLLCTIDGAIPTDSVGLAPSLIFGISIFVGSSGIFVCFWKPL